LLQAMERIFSLHTTSSTRPTIWFYSKGQGRWRPTRLPFHPSGRPPTQTPLPHGGKWFLPGHRKRFSLVYHSPSGAALYNSGPSLRRLLLRYWRVPLRRHW
jgi:hypothetical protein